MSECLGNYYIRNGCLEACSGFRAAILNQSSYIYEVFRVIGGIPLFLEDHVERLSNSAQLTNHSLPWSYDDLEILVRMLIQANDMENGNLKIVFQPEAPSHEAGFLVYITEHQYPSLQQYKDGVAAMLFEGVRDNPNAKVMDVALRKQTNEVKNKEHVYETLLVDVGGYITEGSRSNVFFIHKDMVVTPPLGDVLPGITRKHIIECCRDLHIKLAEEKVHVTQLDQIDAAFISGTSRRVLPLNRINQYVLHPGHQLTRIIQHAFNNRITAYLLQKEFNKQ